MSHFRRPKNDCCRFGSPKTVTDFETSEIICEHLQNIVKISIGKLLNAAGASRITTRRIITYTRFYSFQVQLATEQAGVCNSAYFFYNDIKH